MSREEDDSQEEDDGLFRDPKRIAKDRRHPKPTRPNSHLFRQVVQSCGISCNWSEKSSQGIQTVTFTGLRDLRKALELLGRKFRLIGVENSSTTFQQKFELSEEYSGEWARRAAETQALLEKALLKSLQKPAYASESSSSYDTYSAREVASFVRAVSQGHDVRVVRRIWDNTFRR